MALSTLARRLVNPRLVEDPPPYRPSPVLRGPIHLPVEIDGVTAQLAADLKQRLPAGPIREPAEPTPSSPH